MPELPEFCCVVHNVSGETILVKRGERGYWPRPDLDARAFNEKRGITAPIAAAMAMGSMFGFHVPAADPTGYTAAEAESIAYRKEES